MAALAFLSLPAQLAWGRFSAWIKDIPLQVAVIVGFGAWTAHSLTDFNFIGSGLMVLAVVVSLLALEPEEMPAPESQRSQWPISLSLGLLLGFVAVWSNKLQAPAQLALQELERSDLTLPQRDFLVRTGLRHRPYYMEPWQKLSWKCWEEDAVHPSAEARQIGLEAVRRMVALTPHRSNVLVYAAKVEATVAPAFIRGESAEAQRSNLSWQLDRAEALAKQAKLWAGQDQLCLQQVDEVLALCARRRQELQLPSP